MPALTGALNRFSSVSPPASPDVEQEEVQAVAAFSGSGPISARAPAHRLRWALAHKSLPTPVIAARNDVLVR
jgi:hypothetical protein